ncbi:MAG: sugar phosphate nucleotidyltransferase [Myxococcota bacterium]
MSGFPRRAMVLAAGKGTRLAPLTDERPKPLFPLGPFPILHYPLMMLRQAGITDVMINLHHLGSQIRDRFGDGGDLELSLRYSEEHPALLGTGGGIKKARAFLEDAPFVLVNGDTLVDVDLSEVLAFHKDKGAAATMVLVEARPEAAYGIVAVDSDLRVRDIAGRARWQGRPARLGHFCGIHVIEPRVFAFMPDADAFCINADVYPRLLAAGEPIQGCFLARRFSDVGTPARYLAAAADLLDGRLNLPYLRDTGWNGRSAGQEGASGLRVAGDAAVHPGATLKPPVYIGAGASVEAGAAVGPYALMGRGSRAGTGSRVSHTIVWGEARVGAGEALARCILTPRQCLQISSE